MKDILKTITKKELRFVFLVTLGLLILTVIPFIYGYLHTPEEKVFTGLRASGMGDYYVYRSYIEQARGGDLLFSDLYTSEGGGYRFLNIFWMSVGLFARIFHLPSFIAFHGARSILAFILSFVSYVFISLIFSEKIKRKIAFIFLTFSAGVGFWAAPFINAFSKSIVSGEVYNWPMDLWVPEGYQFLTIYHSPHYIFSTALIFIGFLWFFLALEKNSIKYAIYSGVAALILFQFHPFHVPTFFAVAGVYTLAMSLRQKKIIFWKYLKYFLIVFLISLPSIIYYFVLMSFDHVTINRALQNDCLTPVFWIVVLSYGFLLVFSIGAMWLAIRKKIKMGNLFIFLMIWMFAQLILLFSPFNWQRRMSQGLIFPLAMFSAMFIFYLYGIRGKYRILGAIFRQEILMAFLFLIMFAFSPLANILRDMVLINKIELVEYPQLFYAQEERIAAMNWIKDNTEKDAVIFCDSVNGNFIPGISARRVFAGHGVETLFYDQKTGYINWFFLHNKEDGRRRDLLKREGIDYIFYSDLERGLGDWRPEGKDYLEKVYEDRTVSIYKTI